jgi:hypothetical protein
MSSDSSEGLSDSSKDFETNGTSSNSGSLRDYVASGFRQVPNDPEVARALAHGAAIVGKKSGTPGFLEATAMSKSESLRLDMQKAATEMSSAGTMVQLGSVADVISGDLAVGMLCFVNVGNERVAFQIDQFDAAVALFGASALVNHDHKIKFSRHELAVLPIAHSLTLAFYNSAESRAQLPLTGRSPRGAFIRSVSPFVISIMDTEREWAQIPGLPIRDSMSPPLLPPSDAHTTARQHDPSKQRVTSLSPNVSVVFQGELNRYVNSVYSCVYDAVAGRGCFGGGTSGSTHELRILLSSKVCIELMSGKWVDLCWFVTQPKGKHIMSKESDGIVVDREVWESWSVPQVESCWFNARVIYDRLLGFTVMFSTKWSNVWTELQRLRLEEYEFYPLLVYGWVQYELLHEVASDFFGAITRPDLTVEQMATALEEFKIDENSLRFKKSYGAKEKLQMLTVVNAKVRARETVMLDDDSNSDIKRTRKEKGKEGKDKKKVTIVPPTGGGGHADSSPLRCFPYLSTAGCDKSDADCPYLHETATSLGSKIKKAIKKGLTKRSLVPDPAKF